MKSLRGMSGDISLEIMDIEREDACGADTLKDYLPSQSLKDLGIVYVHVR